MAAILALAFLVLIAVAKLHQARRHHRQERDIYDRLQRAAIGGRDRGLAGDRWW